MMKAKILLIASLFFLAILVIARENPPVDNWCDAGGAWDDGRCNQGDEYQQDWYWTCGWYMAQVDKGTLTIDNLRENVPLCESLYETGYMPKVPPDTTPIASPPPESVVTPEDVTPTPTETIETDEYKTLRVGLGSREIFSIDPAYADGYADEQALLQMYTGLTTIDEEQLKVLPAMATSWDSVDNGDGTHSYIFHLRDDVPWVRYNPDSEQVEPIGRIVTASDFLYGIERTLEIDSYFADYVLEPEIIGVQALDDYTLQITTAFYASYQLAIFAQWYTFPQPEWLINQYGDSWTDAEHFVSYGSYALKDWNQDDSMTLVHNPYWFEPVAIDEIQFTTGNTEEQLEDYQRGKLDYLWDISSSVDALIKANQELAEQVHINLESGVYFYGFNASIPPFDNVHCRRAFSYAIDREEIVDFRTFGQAAPYYSSPNLMASPQLEDYPNLGISYNPELAIIELNQCLQEKQLNSPSELPKVTLVFNSGTGHEEIALAIQQMWLDNLGVGVSLEIVDFATLIDARGEYPIWRGGWIADFADAHSSMGVFMSGNGYYGDLVNTSPYDSLMRQAMVTSDNRVRTELYAEANQLLVYDEAMIIPLYWYTRTQLTQPNISRTVSRLNHERFDKWDVNG